MSTAKKTLYAAIGAGTTAIEKARELPQIVIKLPETLKTQKLNIDIRELPKTVREFVPAIPARATGLVDEARKASAKAQKRFDKAFTDFSKRGETLAKKVQRSAPVKRASAQTKAARSKVKAATTSVKKAAVADVEAAKATVEKTNEATA